MGERHLDARVDVYALGVVADRALGTRWASRVLAESRAHAKLKGCGCHQPPPCFPSTFSGATGDALISWWRVASDVPAVEQPPFPFLSASTDRLRDALLEAVVRHREAETALYVAIGECVRHVRDQGMSPEATLLTMKALLRHTSGTSVIKGAGSAWLTERRMSGLVEWILIEYFDQS